MIFAEFLMNRNSRRVFFDEMIDFTIKKRYFGGRVRKERSGRPRREKKDTKYSYDKYGLLHRSRLNVFADVDNLFDKLLTSMYQRCVKIYQICELSQRVAKCIQTFTKVCLCFAKTRLN